MTLAAIADAVRARFTTLVSTPAPALTTVLDNAPVPAGKTRWCRFSVGMSGGSQIMTGGPSQRVFRYGGVAWALLFEQVDIGGDGELWTLIDRITSAFRGVTLSTPARIVFGVPVPSPRPVVEQGWWRRDVQIPFQADEIGGGSP